MQAMAHECELLQQDELQVLESIYPEYIRRGANDATVELEIPIEFDSPQEVVIHDPSTRDGSLEGTQRLSLTVLPPLLLHLVLPKGYPTDVPPDIVHINASQSWLPRLSRLQALLLQMWTPGCTVLYNWIEYIRTGDFFKSVDMIEKGAFRIPNPVPKFLADLLASHQKQIVSANFMQSTYSCSVCLTEYKGTKCVQLSCNHTFCRSCLEDFWGLCITEGDVARVGCPDPECVKAGRAATEDEVCRIVPEDQLTRWRWLREKRALENDPGAVSCPIPCCQALVPSPPSTDEESGWVKLRTCPKCGFSFCNFCKRSWHGPLSSCPISAIESMILEYRALPEGDRKREELEQQIGKKMFTKLIAKYEEELLNMKWLEASTMACPRCNVHVEKSLGCNHMTCVKCLQHFCYRCGQKLDPSNPYRHFSTLGIPCYNKLFDFNAEEEEWEVLDNFERAFGAV
ncbi:translation termination inhibitor protein itt1 [Pleurotus pulmonarius]|nr:translation termination inhibitor protein itt1 [Pleurotus pulmonarius]KAF4606918.1 translation termination inhibitor protein itt1 [Pleurotus pulmonarius]